MSVDISPADSELVENIETLTICLVRVFNGENFQQSTLDSAANESAANSSEPADESANSDEPADAVANSGEPADAVATEEVKSEKEDLCHIRLERDKLELKCSKMKQCIEQMEFDLKKLQQFEQTSRSLECELQIKANDLIKLEASKLKAEEESEQLRKENQRLKSQLDDLTSQCSQSEEAAKRAEASADKLKKQLVDLQNFCNAQQDALNHNRNALEAKADVEQQLTKSIDHVNRLRQQNVLNIEAFKKRNKDLSARLKAHAETLSQCNQARKSLESELERKTRAFDELAVSQQKLQEDSERLRKENHALESRVENLSKVAEADQQNFVAVKKDLNDLLIKFKKQNELIDQGKNSVKLLDSKLHEKNLALIAEKNVNQKLCEELEKVRSENQLIILSYQVAQQHSDDTKKRFDDLLMEFETQAEFEGKTSILTELENSKKNIQEELEKTRSKNQLLKYSGRHSEATIERLQGMAENRKIEIQEVREKLNRVEKELDTKTTLEQKLKTTLNELTRRLECQAEESSNRQKEAKRIQDQLYGKICEHSNLRLKAENRLAHLNTELVEAKLLLELKQTQLASAENRMKKAAILLTEPTTIQYLRLDHAKSVSEKPDYHAHRCGKLEAQIKQLKKMGTNSNQFTTVESESKHSGHDHPSLSADHTGAQMRNPEVKTMLYQVHNDLEQTRQHLVRASERLHQSQELADEWHNLSDDLEREMDALKQQLLGVLGRLNGITETYKCLRKRFCQELTASTSVWSNPLTH